MVETASVSPTVSQAYDITHLQRKLASRLLLAFLVPLLAMVGLALYTYVLSRKVEQEGKLVSEVKQLIDEVTLLQKKSDAERWFDKSRNLDAAIVAFDALAKTHDRPDILVRLGALYFQRGRPGDDERAFHLLEKSKTLNRDYPQTYSVLAYIYTSKKRWKEAIETGEIALGLDRLDGQTLNNLAWVYATSPSSEIKDYARAKEYAKRAVELTNRQNASYLDTLAEAYFGAGEGGLAIETSYEALRLESGKVRYLDNQLKRFCLGGKPSTPSTQEICRKEAGRSRS